MSVINFYDLPITALANTLLQEMPSTMPKALSRFKSQWQHITQQTLNLVNLTDEQIEAVKVDWLIAVFNTLFSTQNVTLVRGDFEPEFFPSVDGQPARIEFAHGFFQSALHEISHWSLAGARRRTLSDFGYWYAPDGRTEAQQHAFEQVEIKPQAIECLLSLMCQRRFRVSQDNLHANFDTSQSTFAIDVYNQALSYLNAPQTLPKDAKILLTALAYLCHDTIA